jgi:hypothetical protein
LLLVLASAVILGSKSRGTHDHILLSQIRVSPNLEDQVPVFISLRNRVVRLYSQALSSCETSRLPHFLDNRLTDGVEVVRLTRRPPFTPRKISGTHFC